MSESTTLMYAELLSNIRQISVIAALDSPSNSSTRAELSSDGQQFLLRHEGQATILKLPVAASPSFRVQPPAIAAKELSWRLPLAGEPKSADTESTDAPWPAKDLSESTEFLCRSCGGVIVGKGRVKEWRDLPSENWAEMMDFWHCHKPSVPQPSGSGHSHYDPATSRGYGANTKFCAQSGIGFVDLTTLLVAEADCTGVKPKQPPTENQLQYQRLLCKTCDTTLGHLDIQAEGYRLYKWRLKTQSSSRSATSTPTYYKPSTASIIAAQLRSIMLAQCSSRLLLVPVDWTPMPPIPTPPPAVAVSPPPSPKSSEQANPTVVYLWIMNSDLRYSSTVTPSSASAPPGAIPAMKTFFTMPSPSDARSLSETEGIEEVRLPEDAIQDILDSLRGSTQSLPLSSRTFRDRGRVQWMVGLLERFER